MTWKVIKDDKYWPVIEDIKSNDTIFSSYCGLWVTKYFLYELLHKNNEKAWPMDNKAPKLIITDIENICGLTDEDAKKAFPAFLMILNSLKGIKTTKLTVQVVNNGTIGRTMENLAATLQKILLKELLSSLPKIKDQEPSADEISKIVYILDYKFDKTIGPNVGGQNYADFNTLKEALTKPEKDALLKALKKHDDAFKNATISILANLSDSKSNISWMTSMTANLLGYNLKLTVPQVKELTNLNNFRKLQFELGKVNLLNALKSNNSVFNTKEIGIFAKLYPTMSLELIDACEFGDYFGKICAMASKVKMLKNEVGNVQITVNQVEKLTNKYDFDTLVVASQIRKDPNSKTAFKALMASVNSRAKLTGTSLENLFSTHPKLKAFKAILGPNKWLDILSDIPEVDARKDVLPQLKEILALVNKP